jgi:hypothetical protein
MGYKKSIWKPGNHYDSNKETIKPENQKIISLLRIIERAKKQISPISDADLLKIYQGIRIVIDGDIENEKANLSDLIEKIIEIEGCGVKTGLCMLAVISKGEFPPIDDKVTGHLRKNEYLMQEEYERLNSQYIRVERFAQLYLKVRDVWRKQLKENGLSPEELDNKWSEDI